MYVAQPIEWTDQGVVMLDQRRCTLLCHSERSDPTFLDVPHFGTSGRAVEESLGSLNFVSIFCGAC